VKSPLAVGSFPCQDRGKPREPDGGGKGGKGGGGGSNKMVLTFASLPGRGFGNKD